MKLFFDENLSPKLTRILGVEYPQSRHVRDVGLKGTDDNAVWSFCRENNLILVSKDTDFRERSFVEGFPPKVVWLDVGNAGTAEIASLLRTERDRLESFRKDPESSMLILSIGRNAV